MSLNNQHHISAKDRKKHKKELDKHLQQFFALLDSKPKPDNETVRNEFIRHEAEWRLYCCKHSLGIRTSELFNAQVSYQWEQKYVQPNQ